MKKLIKHLHNVNKHRFLVFLHCLRLGIPLRGIKHDLSKYSLKELIPSVKYFIGNVTPVYGQRADNKVYSQIAVTHTHRNKHHYEYWIDIYKNNVVLIMMPYKYILEYVADIISASKVYNKKIYTRAFPYDYFYSHSMYSPMHKGTREFILKILSIYKESGFKKLKKGNTKKIYKEIKDSHPLTEIHPIDLNKDIDIEIKMNK